MTKEKWLNLFYEFLVKNGVLFEYLENIKTNGFSTNVVLNDITVGLIKPQIVSFSEAMNQFTQVLQNSMDNQLDSK